MQQDLLPLFPLRMVLLPGAPAGLHIFEERYKEMIGEAIEHGTEFGIVLAQEKGVVNTGCTATVREVKQKYEDGRMDIEVVGRRRFEILFLNEEKSYLRGAVEFFDDEDDGAPPDDLLARVSADYARLRSLEDEPDYHGDPKLSFRIAQMVEDIDLRQLMLSLRSERARLKQLADFLPAYVARLLHTARIRALARSNGHAHHEVTPE
jgi:Lon protease-like protein